MRENCNWKLKTDLLEISQVSPLEKEPGNVTISDCRGRVATKIFEGFGEALFKEFIKGREPVSSVHYTRPGACINRPLHSAWIQYQVAQPKLISYTTPC